MEMYAIGIMSGREVATWFTSREKQMKQIEDSNQPTVPIRTIEVLY